MQDFYEKLTNIINNKYYKIIKSGFTTKGVKYGMTREWNHKSCFEIVKNPNKKNTKKYPVINIYDREINKFAILAHEFGHFLSWKNKQRPLNFNKIRALFNIQAYDRMTKNELKAIIDEEKLAWYNGILFCKKNNLLLNKDFYKRKRAALRTYYRVYNKYIK